MIGTETIQKLLRRQGYEVIRYPLGHFLRQLEITVVLDVGANAGQYGHEVRSTGFNGKICSFEPLSTAFESLKAATTSDPNWTVKNLALGSEEGTAKIHVASNSTSSSMLAIGERHLNAAPNSKNVGFEEVDVRRLDSIVDSNLASATDRIWLKVDTQGYEVEVMRGAGSSLSRYAALHLELSLVELYDGAPLAEDVLSFARERGFMPIWFTPTFRNPKTQQLLQVDAIFASSDLLK